MIIQKISKTINKISKYSTNHNLYLKHHPNIEIPKYTENINFYRLKKYFIKKKEAL